MDQKISMCPKVDQKMGSRAALEKIKVCRNAIPFRRSFYNISKKKKMLQLQIFHQRKSSSLGGWTRVNYPINRRTLWKELLFLRWIENRLNRTFIESFLISVIFWTFESKSVYITPVVMGGAKNVLASIWVTLKFLSAFLFFFLGS